MENIRFISSFTQYITSYHKEAVGDCVYFLISPSVRAKAFCTETAVRLELISLRCGKLDVVDIPFSHYFKPVYCSPGAPMWTQAIHDGKWRFEEEMPHLLPSKSDCMTLARTMEIYLKMFE